MNTEYKGFPTSWTCRTCKTTAPASVPCRCARHTCDRCGSNDVDVMHYRSFRVDQSVVAEGQYACMACANVGYYKKTF